MLIDTLLPWHWSVYMSDKVGNRNLTIKVRRSKAESRPVPTNKPLETHTGMLML